MWTAVVTIAVLALLAGVALAYAWRSLPSDSGGLVDEVDRLLPQTQCAQCGYPGCRPYAQALVDEDAAINLCPPGGEDTVRRLASLLGKEPLPLADPPPGGRVVAVIDRLNTTFEVWQGTTIGCVQCHGHPYDPFRHEDFYRLYAFFNNTADTDRTDDRPKVSLLSPAQQRTRERLEARLAQQADPTERAHLTAQLAAHQPAPGKAAGPGSQYCRGGGIIPGGARPGLL